MSSADERLALAKEFHDGPLMADDYEFVSDSDLGKWCLGIVEFFMSRCPPTSADAVFGPFGYLKGHRGLSEEDWSLEMDPLENNEEYFSIPLFAKVDPFLEIGREAIRPQPSQSSADKISDAEVEAADCDGCGKPVLYDLLVPDDVWATICPRPIAGWKGGGVLCPECIATALTELATRRAQSAVVGDRWHTIDTAPKDGSVIRLAWFDDGKLQEWFTMQWGHIQQNGLFLENTGMWVTPDGSMTWNGTADNGGPTHWSPPLNATQEGK